VAGCRAECRVEHRIQNTEFRIQNSGDRRQETEDRRIPNFEGQTMNPQAVRTDVDETLEGARSVGAVKRC